MDNLVKKILESVEVGSEYFGTKIHSGNICSEYVRHEVSVWVSFFGDYIEYQTGLKFFGGDFDCPSEEMGIYECTNSDLYDLINDELGDDPITIGDYELSKEQGMALLESLLEKASCEFDLITDNYSDDPDDYYFDTFYERYELKKEDGHYCEAPSYDQFSGETVEGYQFKVTDSRDNTSELVVAVDECHAAKLCGIYISNYSDEYIDKNYTVENISENIS